MDELSGAAASASTSASHVHEAAEIDSDDERPPQPFPHGTTFSHHSHLPVTANNDAAPRRFAAATGNDGSRVLRDDAWSCVIVVITFWFFVSMTLIFGVYGSEILWLGPNSSILIKPHPLFVEYVKAEKLDADNGPMLYGFYGTPPLDVVTEWSEHHKTTLPGSTHKEWMYYLNSGSQIDISYNVTSVRSSSLVFILAQGNEDLAQWLEDPSYPNTTLAWDIIRGTGVIGQGISVSSSYYIAVGNLNTDVVEVELYFKIRALLFSTDHAYYRCSFGHGECSVKIFFPGGNSALLATPHFKLGYNPIAIDAMEEAMKCFWCYHHKNGVEMGFRVLLLSMNLGDTSGKWRVKLSYGPRWITYLGSIGGMAILMLLALRVFNNSRCIRQDETGAQPGDMGSQRAPLISRKDDDLSSLGSSYDSISQDDEYLEDGPAWGSAEGNPTGDSEYNNNIRRLCAICFDAPRDCFFLPCGHCVACYACAMRIQEAAGTCPICRRYMKKVRKIYTV